MAQQRPSERETANGLAQDINLSKASRVVSRNPELQGYLLIAAGAIMILFALGFFPLLKWAIFAVGAAILAWGVSRAHLIERTTEWIQHMRSRR